eukprot:GHVN01002422.1.p2 GENE.GHVN01002422.1~~GHVN01002422.1.p2  ORF type:complete len:1027 (-),score=213.04 GHVN01002422.1:9784-12453(-)
MPPPVTEKPLSGPVGLAAMRPEARLALPKTRLHVKVEDVPAASLDKYVLPGIPEEVLVRDILFCLQGVNGQYIHYHSAHDAYLLDSAIPACTSVRRLITRLCQLGVLYRKVKDVVDYAAKERPQSVLYEAFTHCVSSQLTEYYKLIAVLENELIARHNDKIGYGRVKVQGLSLRRLAVWEQEPMERMRLLAILVECSHGLKGGPLASMLHAHSRRGDPESVQLMMKTLSRVIAPLLEMVVRWMEEGLVNDTFDEFFVKPIPGGPADKSATDTSQLAVYLAGTDVTHAPVEPPNTGPRSPSQLRPDTPAVGEAGRGPATPNEVWVFGHYLATDEVPSFLPMHVAKKIHLAGKSVYFIRHCCAESDWLRELDAGIGVDGKTVDALLEDAASREEAGRPGSGAVPSVRALTALVEMEAEKKNRQLLHLLYKKYHFKEHCRAIRMFLLLGQGDFTEALLTSADSLLSQRQTEVPLHDLLGLLDAAIRSSNAQYRPPDTLRRLGIKKLQGSGNDTGWDVMALDYLVANSPVSVVFTSEVMGMYQKVFNLLWKLKRACFDLTQSWRLQSRQSHLLLHRRLRATLHGCHMAQHSFLHFARSIYGHLMHRVLDSAWKTFNKRLKVCADLDELLFVHHLYLEEIKANAFLTHEPMSETVGEMVTAARQNVERGTAYTSTAGTGTGRWAGRGLGVSDGADAAAGPGTPLRPSSRPILDLIQSQVEITSKFTKLKARVYAVAEEFFEMDDDQSPSSSGSSPSPQHRRGQRSPQSLNSTQSQRRPRQQRNTAAAGEPFPITVLNELSELREKFKEGQLNLLQLLRNKEQKENNDSIRALINALDMNSHYSSRRSQWAEMSNLSVTDPLQHLGATSHLTSLPRAPQATTLLEARVLGQASGR